MRHRRGTPLLLFLTILLLGVGTIFAFEDKNSQENQGRAEEFHAMTGGVGFGHALDTSQCANCFDPRLDGACAMGRGPLPDGACFCPRHTASFFGFAPLRDSTLPYFDEDRNGPLP